MVIVRALAKGQVVIPKAIRDRFNIKLGSRFLLRVTGSDILLKPLPEDPIRALQGILKRGGPSTSDLLRMRREERRRESRNLA